MSAQGTASLNGRGLDQCARVVGLAVNDTVPASKAV